MQYFWGFWKDAVKREKSPKDKAHIRVKGIVTGGYIVWRGGWPLSPLSK